MNLMTPSWITAFLDLPAGRHEAALDFWRDVTGYAVSPPRGEHDEFVTLVPPEGDPHLKVQRTGDAAPRIHLDLHADDPRALAGRAVGLGAHEVDDHGYVVLTSPGGLTFCCVSHPSSTPAPPTTWSDGSRSIVDQVCIDAPEAAYDAEADFWESLLGWKRIGTGQSEFERLLRPDGQTVRVLLQRLEEPTGRVRAHLDLASREREVETARHEALGATLVDTFEWWTVLRDPARAAYCITDRTPE